MSFRYAIADCPGWIPGMALAHNVCENCGGDRHEDHPINNRNGANSVKRRPAQTPAFPASVTYPCGCFAFGDGSAQLPGYCPSHSSQGISETPINHADYFSAAKPEGEPTDADGQPGQVPDEQSEGASRECDAPGEPGSEA